MCWEIQPVNQSVNPDATDLSENCNLISLEYGLGFGILNFFKLNLWIQMSDLCVFICHFKTFLSADIFHQKSGGNGISHRVH